MIPFAGNPLNRASEKRTDSNWIESKRRDPSSLVLPMWRLQPFLLGPEKSGPPLELGLVRPGIADSLAGAKQRASFWASMATGRYLRLTCRKRATLRRPDRSPDSAISATRVRRHRWSRSKTPQSSRRRRR